MEERSAIGMKNEHRKNIAAAVFQDHDQAEKAVHELRNAGVPESAISVIKLHNERDASTHDDVNRVDLQEGDTKGSGIGKGLAAGGTVGAVAGLAALVIPGVGPFIAAGALAETLGAVGSAAVVSGAVGAAAGGLAASLIDYGVDEEHAKAYEKKVREGGTLVTVDTSDRESAYAPTRAILRSAGGESLESDQRESAAT